jgi:Putative transposase
MVEVAANLIENVIPCVPVRQFVISFPKRIRHYLQTHSILQAVLRIVVDEIRKKLITCSPDVPNPKIGAVSFFQNFGNTLNVHPHFHLVFADGVFTIEEDTLLFCESCVSAQDITGIEECIRKRVFRYFGRRGFFKKEEITTMLSYEMSGFLLDGIDCSHL